MMRTTRFLAAAAMLLPLLGVVSCGSSPTTPTPPPPVVEPPPPPPPPPPTLTVTRILAFGDSLTQGASLGQPLTPWGGIESHRNPDTSYPFQLQKMLNDIYTSQTIVVTNAGEGGEKVIGSVARDRLITELDDHNPEVLLLMHGVNSLNDLVGTGRSDTEIVNETADAVDELIETAKSRKPGIRIMLATLPRQTTGLSGKTASAHLIPAYNDAMRLNASEEGADLVDIYAVITAADLMPDGLHINPAGNIKMAEAFYAAIKACCHRD